MQPAARIPFVIVVACAALVASCGTTRRAQLEAVAKDWCETIRASQVVPVYPLTQDLQPGDVFLVQVPIDVQQEIYDRKGFLPLDHHVARFDPTRYATFYRSSFVDEGTPLTLPKSWLRAAEGRASWESAPRAAFPSYGFTVQRGAGLSLAVPVKGVPVGLSLLGSDTATGSITIADARTIGIDVESAWRDLRLWAAANADFVAGFAPRDGRTNYLRVVTRVYLTGRIDVQLSAAESSGAGLDVGAPKPIEMLNEPPPQEGDHQTNALARYEKNLAALNAMLKKASETTTAAGGSRLIPGGSLRVTAAAGRTISLVDTFDPPLVLGYLGFDCAILDDGRIGAPVATHAVLDGQVVGGELLRESPLVQTQTASMGRAAYRLLREGRADPELDAASRARAAEAVAALDRLGRFVDTTAPFYDEVTLQPLVVERQIPEDDEFGAPGERGYSDFLTYRGRLTSTERSLAAALATPSFVVRDASGDVTVRPGSASHDELTKHLAAVRVRLADPVLRDEVSTATTEAVRAAVALFHSPAAR